MMNGSPISVRPGTRSAWPVFALAAATVILHLAIGNRYGFHRDELATLDDAWHLAWGYVAYPPLTPFFGRLALEWFGTSLVGFRLFASLANAASIIVAGKIAGELGGGRGSQLLAAAAPLPFCLIAGSMMQYVSFDYLWWTLGAYFMVRLLRSNDPRWWMAIGAVIGIGMQTKYTTGVFALSVAAATFFTPLRVHLRNQWLWIGVAISLLIFLPNALWQWQHRFISADFLRHIHERDIRIGRTKDFFPDQLKLTLLAFPLAMLGLWHCFRDRLLRPLAWMFVAVVAIFALTKARGYYLAPAYPPLFAAGAVWLARKLREMKPASRMAVSSGIALAVALDVAVACFVLPIPSIGSEWFKKASAINGDLVEEIGWQELAATVAQVRDSLPAAEKDGLGILAGNYGEAGALNLYGPSHRLPRAISGINSFWLRGYGDPPPQHLIVVGISQRFLDEHFTGCRLAGHVTNAYNVRNEETERHPDIYVCGTPKRGWAEFWRTEFPWFG